MTLPLASQAHAQASTLQPIIVKPHNADDSGTEIGPNHFALGHKLTDNGRWYVSLILRWETTDGKGLADYCHENAKVLDDQGNVVVERAQRLGGCAYGGNWKFKLYTPGDYTYVLDIAPEDGGNYHAELPFKVNS
ncbi:hypothetical protein [Mycobacterium sp. 852014-52144_SCH5372336]|uniref:hypothetical protein n=1 Tax=Mycobacterium sp. 852014-52144_SCH5372336 TaxID=1834115 RepID=UPI00080079EB|nr:hypothetical protein [Mycobacterium sp. 852014-52144_SCH5372336]OBB77410.1 hypothetical protein A5759_04005 [Mycobacterium sp. 852014-52144_SCH5372336]